MSITKQATCEEDVICVEMAHEDVTVVVYRSHHDGTVVVQIDTGASFTENQQGVTPLRVYLNDGDLYTNPDLVC